MELKEVARKGEKDPFGNWLSGEESTSEGLNSFFKDWAGHSELTRLNVIKSLKQLGPLSFVGKPKEDGFSCPLYRFPLNTPCSITGCPYQVSHAPSKNCTINAIETNKQARLSPQEISQLLGVSVAVVNTSLDNSVKLVQLALVQDRLTHVIIPRFSFLPGHCVSCGVNIVDELGLDPNLTIDSDHGWCSDSCKTKSPSWMFSIEKAFSCDYTFVLAAAFCISRKPDSVDQLLGVPAGVSLSLLPQLRRIVSDFF